MSFLHAIAERVVDVCKSEGDTEFCTTIEWRRDTSVWIQITGWYVNCYYPFKDAPESVLERFGVQLPNSLTLSEWKAGMFVTFEHGSESVDDITIFVQDYAGKILGLVDNEREFFIKEEWF